jgi:hypothetical protein
MFFAQTSALRCDRNYNKNNKKTMPDAGVADG